MSATAVFELSVSRALSDQLTLALEALTPAPLTENELDAVDERGGVYTLMLDDQLVYIGKSTGGLRTRLGQHHRKISGRSNISLARMTFCALYMREDLDAVAPERLLIKDRRPPWNSNGFGNKDPGRQRDKTLVKHGHFDALYPIDLAHPVSDPGGDNLYEFLANLKRILPFNLRYGAASGEEVVYRATARPPVQNGAPVNEVFARVAACLPGTWQLTALPGYAILYPEFETYASARWYWRKRDGEVVSLAGAFTLGEGRAEPDAEEEPD